MTGPSERQWLRAQTGMALVLAATIVGFVALAGAPWAPTLAVATVCALGVWRSHRRRSRRLAEKHRRRGAAYAAYEREQLQRGAEPPRCA